jgi:hypothetical protein
MGSLSRHPPLLGGCEPPFRVYPLFPRFPIILSQRSLQTESRGKESVLKAQLVFTELSDAFWKDDETWLAMNS